MTYAVRSATVRFGETVGLDDVTVAIEPGSVVVVVGGDGAGKTTLLRSLVGTLALERGQVEAPPTQQIGYFPASAGSWQALTVRQNMDFVGGVYGVSGQHLIDARERLLDRAGLTVAGDRPVSQLSGGMRRKLGFCMAMLHEPLLLVLDEPSTGVDPVSRVDLWRLVSEAAAGGAAVLMSTTYLDEAERAASLLVLDGGRALAGGTLEQVLATLSGTITHSDHAHRSAWSWRRGRVHHEYWPEGSQLPVDVVAAPADLEDVVVALSLIRRQTQAVPA